MQLLFTMCASSIILSNLPKMKKEKRLFNLGIDDSFLFHWGLSKYQRMYSKAFVEHAFPRLVQCRH